MTKADVPSFQALLQGFFCNRLIAQRNASPQTVASYRDTFRLLLGYTAQRTGTTPSDLALDDLTPLLVLAFLEHLEKDRGNSIRTRNARLTAIRSFMRYASYHAPSALPTIQRVLAIPSKRFDKPMLEFLSKEEVEALLASPDPSTWSGRRDIVMLSTFYNTGARVSEVVQLRVQDLVMGQSAYVRIRGKGRKERAVPLWKSTVDRLREWLSQVDPSPDRPLFPNRYGSGMSRSGIEHRRRKAVRGETRQCASLDGRRISPHTLRHTTAIHLLQSGVDITVIALWLGHESPSTTHLYLEADLAMKRRAIANVHEAQCPDVRYGPTDQLLAFLEGL